MRPARYRSFGSMPASSSKTASLHSSDLCIHLCSMTNPSDSFVRSVQTGRIEKEKNVTSKALKRRSSGRLTPAELEYRQALHNLRLRETFTIILREKTQILEENRRLKDILAAHGIPFDPKDIAHTTHLTQQQQQQAQAPEVARFGRTYDEIGVDFVLA